MAFGWLKALQIGYSLYTAGRKVAPLVQRSQQRADAAANASGVNRALAEMTGTLRQLAADAAEDRRTLRIVRAVSIAALIVSIVTLGIVTVHLV